MADPRRLAQLAGLFCWLFCFPALAEDLWEISEGAPTWEPLWDEGALLVPDTWTLSLVGGHGRRSLSAFDLVGRDDRRQNETYAMATLTLPLDTLLGRRARVRKQPAKHVDEPDLSHEGSGNLEEGSEQQGLPVGVSASLEDVQSPSPSLSPGESGSSETSSEGPSSKVEVGKSPVPAEPSQQEEQGITRVKRASESERLLALVSALSDRVAGSSGVGQHERRLDALATRARWSGLAPELRLRGVYGFDQTTSLEDATGLYPGETTTRGGRDSLAEVRLTFHLDRLVFSSQEPGFERQRLLAQSERRKLQTIAIDLFFEWRAADEASRDPALFADEQLPLQIKAHNALAHLHLLTKGWFRGQKTMARFGLGPSVAPLPQKDEPSPSSPRTSTRSDGETNSSNSSR